MRFVATLLVMTRHRTFYEIIKDNGLHKSQVTLQ